MRLLWHCQHGFATAGLQGLIRPANMRPYSWELFHDALRIRVGHSAIAGQQFPAFDADKLDFRWLGILNRHPQQPDFTVGLFDDLVAFPWLDQTGKRTGPALVVNLGF